MNKPLFFCIVGIVALLIIVLSLVLYIVILKQEMKKMREELQNTRTMDYNRQMTVTLVDSDLTNLTTELNQNLDFQKELKLETERKEKQIKQSISDIAHDLRTPLTVVKGNLQMLEREGELSPYSKNYVDICLEKTDALKNMVDEFFELSVLESENVPINLQRVDLTNLLAQFIIDHEAVIIEHGLAPEILLPEKSIFIMADDSMLVRIFSNLLNNIFQYAQDSFKIDLVEKEEGWIVVSFSNQVEEGREIDVNRLFDRTYRADRARQGKGAGLGLYIVKLLAEKQKIQVWAEYEAMQLSFCLKIKKENI